MHQLLHALSLRAFARSADAPASREPLLSEDEARQLAGLEAEHTLDLLAVARQAASLARQTVFTCGVINAKSGRCPENCAFCAQSAHYETGAPVFPLVDEDAVLRKAQELADAGARRFGIVTSGTAPSDADMDALYRMVRRIRQEVPIVVCASLGMLTPDRARSLKQAGLGRYHHNLETSAGHFSAICSTHTYEQDLESVRAAQAAGLETCSGGIFGLGETWDQRIELSLTLRELDVDSIPVNFLNPIPGTPLEHQPVLRPAEALRILVILRFMHPNRDILVCGGRNVALRDWDAWLFAAGANGLMTGNYLTTTGSTYDRDNAMLRELGLRGE